MLQFLIDADMVVFESCASEMIPVEWEDGLWTYQVTEADIQNHIDSIVERILGDVCTKLNYEGQWGITMCFSDANSNFRKRIYPEYKANRKHLRKPLCYPTIVQWVKDNYNTLQLPDIEADDCVGILATSLGGDIVNVSGDKDFKSIPGYFYNYQKAEISRISRKEADRWFLTQTLIGDTADHYPGCPTVGIKTAEKIFDKFGATWETVRDAFIAHGKTEEDALTQARVARILRAEDYDMEKQEVKLWSPMR